MIDTLFGRSFWPMVWRFALAPIAMMVLFSPLFLFMESPETDISLWGHAWIALFNMAGWSWVGWGLAFWRFEREDIPVQSFALYPLVSGLVVIPMFWILNQTSVDPESNELITLTVFGALAGPIMAIMVSSFWRYAPNMTSLKNSKP